jgi:hypothetical protein
MKDMAISKEQIKQAVERTLDELPAEKAGEVLDFAQFLRARRNQEAAQGVAVPEPTRLILRTVPASYLDRLEALVAWGGDAVADSERLYDDNPSACRD